MTSTTSITRRTAVAVAAVLTIVGLTFTDDASAGSNAITASPTELRAGESMDLTQTCWPPSGPIRTATQASGGMAAAEPMYPNVDVILAEGWTPSGVPEGTVVASLDEIPVESDHEHGYQWTATLTIPAGTAPGSYTLTGFCNAHAEWSYQYANVEVTVLPSATSSTTTTSVPASTTTSVPSEVGATDTAKPATPRPGTPTYTG